MHGDADGKTEFISYPTHRVVGTIEDPRSARAAIEALSRAGFEPSEIDVLHGEEDLRRLDPTGEEHGFLARFQRTLIRHVAPMEEYRHLRQHVDDVRAGRFVIMVLAKERDKRQRAADILNAHDAEFVGFYGRWAYESLEETGTAGSGRSSVDTTYEIDLDGIVTRVRYESGSSAVITDPAEPASGRVAKVTWVRPGVSLLSWQDADAVPVVCVADVENGTAYGSVVRGGTLQHVEGTVRRVE